MTVDFDSLSLLRPHALWALLALPLVIRMARQNRASRNPWSDFVDPALIRELFPDTAMNRARVHRKSGLAAIGWALFCVALAGPSFGHTKVPTAPPQSQALVVLGLSQSMRAEDLSPDRLTRARIAAGEWISERDGRDIGLVVFAGSPFRVSPLTRDQDTLLHLLNSVQPDVLPRGGHDIAKALALASTLFTARNGSRELLLISDHNFSASDEDAISELVQDQVKVSVLGLGTSGGAPIPLANGRFATTADGSLAMAQLDLAAQRRSALRSGARWLQAANMTGAVPLDAIASSGQLEADETPQRSEIPRDDGIWLLLPLLIIAALGFRRGAIWMTVLTLAPTFLSVAPGVAYAEGDVPEAELPTRPAWMLNREMRAYRDWKLSPSDATARRLPTADWRGTAAFETGDFEKAATEFAAGEDPEARYNQALALAHADRIDDAIQGFERVLEQHPDHADARRNLEILKQVKQQQSAQNGDQKQQGDQSGSDSDQASDSRDSQPQDAKQQNENQQAQDSPDAADDAQSQQQADEQSEASSDPQPANPQEADAQQDPEEAAESGNPQDQATPEPDENDAESEAQSLTASPSDQEETERSIRQWLNRVEKDPARILRNRFRTVEANRRNNAGGDSKDRD